MHPFFLRADHRGRPQVIVHSKFWLVDAKSTVTGARTKLAYAGSSNWRADQQYSDDMLLRIADDGVYARYSRVLGADPRAARRRTRPAPRPSHHAVLGARRDTGAQRAGWNSSDVTVRVAAQRRPQLAGQRAQAAPRRDVRRPERRMGLRGRDERLQRPGARRHRRGRDHRHVLLRGRQGQRRAAAGRTSSASTRPRRRSPACRAAASCGRPTTGCATSPMCSPSTVSRAWTGSRCPARATTLSDEGDIAIQGGSVDLRAEKAAHGDARTYVVSATATDVAGNSSTGSGTCIVPHSMAG